jgi:hypothetical protein
MYEMIKTIFGNVKTMFELSFFRWFFFFFFFLDQLFATVMIWEIDGSFSRDCLCVGPWTRFFPV